MSFYVESKSGGYKPCPAGNHLARCYRVVDLGTQKSNFPGDSTFKHKIMIEWEVHSVDDAGQPLRLEDGRPFSVSKDYTLSWAEKATLRKHLQSWRGKPFTQEEMRRFDLEKLLGAWCMVAVIHNPGKNDKVYANVDNVTSVPSVMKQNLPEAVNSVEIFSLQEPDMALFETFSQHLKAKIQASPEWEKLQGKVAKAPAAPSGGDEIDDIPF